MLLPLWTSLALVAGVRWARATSAPAPSPLPAASRLAQHERWQVRGVLKSKATAELPVVSCELVDATLALGATRGELKGQFVCTDPEGEPVFQVPIRMSAYNIQRADTTFVFDLKETQTDVMDARMNGVRVSAGTVSGFARFRLTIPPSDDLIFTGRWTGARR